MNYLFIPAYRCEKQVVRVLRSIADNNNLLKIYTKIIIVENRSPDKTLQVITNFVDLHPQLKSITTLLQNNENFGLGGSHKVAFKKAINEGAQLVSVLHGDDQALSEELENLNEVAQKNPHAAAVLGSRFSSYSKLDGYSVVREYGNRMLNIFYSLVWLRRIEDLGSGLNIFRVEHIKQIDNRLLSDDFHFNMDLLNAFCHLKFDFRFYPITWREQDQSSNARNFKVGYSALLSCLKWRLNLEKPVYHSAEQLTSTVVF